MDMHVHYNSLPPSEKQQCEWSKSELHVWRTWTRIKPFIKFLFRTSFFNQCCPWHCCHGFLNTLFTETSGLEGHCEKKLSHLSKGWWQDLNTKPLPLHWILVLLQGNNLVSFLRCDIFFLTCEGLGELQKAVETLASSSCSHSISHSSKLSLIFLLLDRNTLQVFNSLNNSGACHP